MSFLGNKTQRMHPLYVPVANKVDYFFYTAFRRINPFSVIAMALLIYSLVGFVGDIRSLFSDSVWDRVLYIAAFILSGVVAARHSHQKEGKLGSDIQQIPAAQPPQGHVQRQAVL